MPYLPSFDELMQDVFETEIPTVTELVSSMNPAPYGTDLTFTATVTASGGPVGRGAVQFYVDGAAFGSPMAIASSGVVQTVVADLPIGQHTIRAEYLP